MKAEIHRALQQKCCSWLQQPYIFFLFSSFLDETTWIDNIFFFYAVLFCCMSDRRTPVASTEGLFVLAEYYSLLMFISVLQIVQNSICFLKTSIGKLTPFFGLVF